MQPLCQPCEAAKVFNGKLKDFEVFHDGSTKTWKTFTDWIAATEAVEEASKAEHHIETVRSINAWSRDTSQKLVPLMSCDDMFFELDVNFKDPRVLGDLSNTYADWRKKFIGGYGTIVKLARNLVLAALLAVSKMPVGLPARLEILSTAQVIATQLCNHLANAKFAAKKTVIRTLSETEAETLENRLHKISELFNVMSELCLDHYREWEAKVSKGPADAAPDQEVQESYNNITARKNDFCKGIKKGGKYEWVTTEATPPHGQLQFFYVPMLPASELGILKVVDTQQGFVSYFV